MANVILRVKREDGSWAEIPALVGPEGPQGVSIDDIVLKSKEGDVSTYSILLSDGSEKTFQVTDGASITDVSLISTDVLIDTYKISISDGSFFNFKVTNGRGIKSIAKTSTDVLSDTYTISYNDNTSSTFKVANGKGIIKIVKSNTDDLTDTYTISYNDNTTSTYTITNGRGIKSIAKTSTNVLSDTYTISYNDNTTSTYTITNGKGITKIDKSNTDILTDTYTISYNDNTTSTYTITNGRGIDYIEKDETIGLSDRYTIHYNDGSTSYYYVTNGEDGPAGGIGNRIYLTGLVNKVDDEEGYGRVKELKESDFDLSKFTVVGSPLISEDGVASGFTTSSTIKPPAPYNTTDFLNVTKSWDITTRIQYLSADTQYRGLFLHYQFPLMGYIGINNTKVGLWGQPTGGAEGEITTETLANLGISDGDFVNIRVTFDVETLTYALYASKNDEPLSFRKSVVKTGNLTVINTAQEVKFACYDGGGYRRDFNGSIDLKQFSITVDGKEVFSGNKTGLDIINNIEIPYTLSKTGSKIVDVAYRDRVEDCYNQYGAGNYYLFSSATEQFALPMPDIYGLIESLLDITAIEGADW